MQFMRISAIMRKIRLRYAYWENICASSSGYLHETANNLSGFGKYKRICGYLKPTKRIYLHETALSATALPDLVLIL